MHPFLAIPVALVGFLLGKVTTKTSEKDAGGGRAPITGVPLGAWEEFVAQMAVAPKGHVSERGRMGTFQMDARKLADTGAMTRAWKGRRGTRDGIWVGEWSAGLTEKAFLESMPLQYAVFVRSMRTAAPKVSGLVGTEVDGKVASLSGLLGVSHAAGERGVGSFVSDPRIRARFPATATVFGRTNEIF